MDAPERSARRPLDAAALSHTLRRMNAAKSAPWLHGEVARRMAERLAIVKLQPERVLDWASFLGSSATLLRTAYPRATQVAVETDAQRLRASSEEPALSWWSPRRWTAGAGQVLAGNDIDAPQGQLLWSNMGLHGAHDPQAVMRQWHRALAVDGFLMFSTLGPGTLPELQRLYTAAGWGAPFAPFVDMHDLGDMLVQAGFADPVMDQETITLTWSQPDALLSELRTLGANLSSQRQAGLRTPRWRQQLMDRLMAQCDEEGRIALRFEVVYGHAFRPLPRPRLAPETSVPLADLRAMVRAPRGGG